MGTVQQFVEWVCLAGLDDGLEAWFGADPLVYAHSLENGLMDPPGVARWTVVPGPADYPMPSDGDVVWERTLAVARTGAWQQFFLSASPSSAAGWSLPAGAVDGIAVHVDRSLRPYSAPLSEEEADVGALLLADFARDGFCTVKTYADGSTVTYTRTPDGLLLRETKPSGAWKENVYDAMRQIVGIVSSDGAQDASMLRDEFGRVTAESNSVALAAYSLDDCWGATNETQTVDGFSVSFKREFDAYGRLARFARVGGEDSVFDYAPHGAISIVSNESVAVGYAFADDSLDAGYALDVQGGLDFSREVFRHGYLRSCIVAVSNHCGNVSQGLEYSYDALQRPVSRNADSFGYNVRGEVVSATIDGRNESHSYDDIGNAVQASYPASTNDFTSNCRNQYSSIAAVAEGTQLVASVSYDLDGNMTRHGEWTYAYDSGNRLVSVASNGTTVATMSYDTQGRRVKKVAADGTHRYFYDGWLLVYENVVRPNNTTNEIEYVWGKDVSGTRDGAAGIGGLLYQKRDGAIYVPWYDAYGNILGYRDAQGNVVASYTYDAFGNIIGQSGTMADTFSFRFSTKYFDADCGLYYYGYRHYKPQIMCWLTEDPLGVDGGLNLYEFCENSPIGIFDFLGNVPLGTTFLNAYTPYNYSHEADEIWRAVGGTLKAFYWNDETKRPPNTCATRISIALIKSNEPVSKGSKQFVNTVKKGEKGIAGNYIVNAAKMQDYLTSAWGTASVLSPTQAYYFKSKVKSFDIVGLRKEIEEKLKCSNIPKDKYVCVVSAKVTDEPGVSGHIGVVTKTYDDGETPYKDHPVVWILPPTKKVITQKR